MNVNSNNLGLNCRRAKSAWTLFIDTLKISSKEKASIRSMRRIITLAAAFATLLNVARAGPLAYGICQVRYGPRPPP